MCGFLWNLIWSILENLLKKFKFDWNRTRVTGTLREDVRPFVMSRPIPLRMRNVSDRICRGNRSTHFMFSNFFFRVSCRLWDNVQKYGRARQTTNDNIIWRMRFACWFLRLQTHT
jgi:hypothetical protein